MYLRAVALQIVDVSAERLVAAFLLMVNGASKARAAGPEKAADADESWRIEAKLDMA